MSRLLPSLAGRIAQAPIRSALLLCTAVGAVSLPLFPSDLGYDPWAWMVWGRELAHFQLGTAGGPSFKPLPVLIATTLAPAGGAALGIWLVLVRVSALFSVVLAFHLARRLAGPVAGALAAAATVCLLLGPLQWATAQGYMAAPSVVLLLGALDRHIDRRRGQAFLLGSLAALIRPEMWPYLAVYGFVHWRRERAQLMFVGSVLVFLPAAWVLPDALASGHVLNGADIARGGLFNGADPAYGGLGGAAGSRHPALQVLSRAVALYTLPGLFAAAAAVVLAVRRADRLVVSLGAAVLIWVCSVAVMAEAGFTGNDSYHAFPGGVVAVLAGVGVVWTVQAVRGRGARLALAAGVGAVAVIHMLTVASSVPVHLRDARAHASQLDQLGVALARAGGRNRVLARGRPAINPMYQTALAWKLHVGLAGVQPAWGSTARRPAWEPPAYVFRSSAVGQRDAEPSLLQPGLTVREVARTGNWSVVLAETPALARCGGLRCARAGQ